MNVGRYEATNGYLESGGVKIHIMAQIFLDTSLGNKVILGLNYWHRWLGITHCWLF